MTQTSDVAQTQALLTTDHVFGLGQAEQHCKPGHLFILRTMEVLPKKTGQKKPTQELILESRSEKKKVYFWVLDHFPMTKPIHRSQERPLRLQEDFLETHRRLGISQAARALKIDTDLPGCILGTSIMSKTTKTPLRNPQRPLRLQG